MGLIMLAPIVKAKSIATTGESYWVHGALCKCTEQKAIPSETYWVLEEISPDIIKEALNANRLKRRCSVSTNLIEVQYDTICIGTSHIDAFGRRIYENDLIVCTNNGGLKRVIYKNHSFYCMENNKQKDLAFLENFTSKVLNETYIVGNFIDTPVKELDYREE